MTTEAVDMEAVALAVSEVLAVLEPEPTIVTASVSAVYTTQRKGEPCYWRCCVSINDTHVFQPRFGSAEDAEAYREAVGQALDRAT